MKAKSTIMITIVITLSILLSSCQQVLSQAPTQTAVYVYLPQTITAMPQPATQIPESVTALESTTTPLPGFTPTIVGDFALQPNTLGDKPSDSNQIVYKLPYEAGTITDDQGRGIYTQSGKDGTAELHGNIPEGAWLVIDSYTLWKGNQEYSSGNIIVIPGPIDLEVAAVSFKDGGANLVKGNIQEFLDDNVWGKFCRGNIAPDGKSFTYKPWALKHIQLPEGITFKPLDGCPKNEFEDTTTVPALP